MSLINSLPAQLLPMMNQPRPLLRLLPPLSNNGHGLNDGYLPSILDILPPGYRFVPTDEELVVYYLKVKVDDMELPRETYRFIHEVNFYEYNPQQLLDKFGSFRDETLYFFTSRKRKYQNGSRPTRSARGGFWKPTGKDTTINNERGGVAGFKKVLDFYQGDHSQGEKTDWKMHEFRVQQTSILPNPTTSQNSMELDKWVLCKLYRTKRSSSGNKNEHNGEPSSSVLSSRKFKKDCKKKDRDHPTEPPSVYMNDRDLDNENGNVMISNNLHQQEPSLVVPDGGYRHHQESSLVFPTDDGGNYRHQDPSSIFPEDDGVYLHQQEPSLAFPDGGYYHHQEPSLVFPADDGGNYYHQEPSLILPDGGYDQDPLHRLFDVPELVTSPLQLTTHFDIDPNYHHLPGSAPAFSYSTYRLTNTNDLNPLPNTDVADLPGAMDHHPLSFESASRKSTFR